MHKDTIGSWEKRFAAFFGTVPAAIILLLTSEMFEAVKLRFSDNPGMILVFYGLLALMWIGSIWIMSRQENPTLLSYFERSAAWTSSPMVLLATIASILIP
ncbi:hypothetical protein NKDENANG_00844 [Candidatus Entotheonellaceae bacterium PAL068K]